MLPRHVEEPYGKVLSQRIGLQSYAKGHKWDEKNAITSLWIERVLLWFNYIFQDGVLCE